MNIVQYGQWKIAVDIEKTKQFYANYKQTNTQANRNFTECCKNLTDEESAFFDSFGIDPVGCEIKTPGVSRKKIFSCYGIYPICGKCIETPPDFRTNRGDYTIHIGNFQFHVFPYRDAWVMINCPEGFIAIQFINTSMQWLLKEKPEIRLDESPRFWKIIKKKYKELISQDPIIKRRKEYIKSATKWNILFFDNLNIKAIPLKKNHFKKYKQKWVDNFSPVDADRNMVREVCIQSSRGFGTYLWHIFSFKILNCKMGEEASALFDKELKKACVFIDNECELMYKLETAENLTAEMLEDFDDITITAEDFSWTYTKTHEKDMYFYKK